MMKATPIFGSQPFGKRDAKLLLVAFFDPAGIETIPQSIEAWQSLSRHEIILVNLWPGRGPKMRLPATMELDDYEGIIIHPTVSYSPAMVSGLDADLSLKLEDFDGVKVLMKQDEQVMSGLLGPLVRDKRFDVVLTCVPPADQEKVYPRSLVGTCAVHQVLTGYLSPTMRDGFSRGVRDIHLSYRGSIQPLAFGRLGYEKRGIGYDVAGALTRQGAIRFDISSRWEDRLSGQAWTEFLARSGVVLGVESGSNIFDFDGDVAKRCTSYEERHSGEDRSSLEFYKRAHDEFLYEFEGNVNYAQISPRHFEAAAAGAAQLLYEGVYSNIFIPERHFFPLRRDLGNIDAAVDFLRDDLAQRRMAECAFEEIILNELYWYESFVARADDIIDLKFAEKGSNRLARKAAERPLAYILTPDSPTHDPRARRFALTLAETHDVVVIGVVDSEVDNGSLGIESISDGVTAFKVPRTKHGAAWLPTAAQLRQSPSIGRTLLATLAGYAGSTDRVLSELLGAHVAVESEISRFRDLCARFVDTNAALLFAIANLGAPDIVVGTNLDTLFAAAACGETEGSRVVFDARQFWPYFFTDFQHWETEFWTSMEDGWQH